MKAEEDRIRYLTQKLKTQGDILLEEADEIYSLFLDPSIEKTKLNLFRGDSELMQVLEEWYCVVAEEVRQGHRGNFVFTIRLDSGFHNKYMYPAQKIIKEHGNFKDLCSIVMIDKKFYPSLPFRHVFAETKAHLQNMNNYYEMLNVRAGMYYYPIKTDLGYYTISQFIEKLSPAMIATVPGLMMHKLFKTAFEIAAGAREIPHDSAALGEKELEPYILAAFMKYEDIPCVAASSAYTGKSIIFVEEKNIPIIEKAKKIPFKELVKNALDQNIIDEIMAKELLNGPIINFPTTKFIEASARYLGEKVRMKMARECMQEIAGNAQEYLEEIRQGERMNSDEIKRLIQKLETENDISLEEANQLFSCMELFAKSYLKTGDVSRFSTIN